MLRRRTIGYRAAVACQNTGWALINPVGELGPALASLPKRLEVYFEWRGLPIAVRETGLHQGSVMAPLLIAYNRLFTEAPRHW